jgi:antitoxin MazE
MQVAKWGNSLAVRLPAKQVERLELKEGDEVELVETERGVELRKKLTREEAFKALRQFRGRMPAGFRFDRDEANRRGSDDAE